MTAFGKFCAGAKSQNEACRARMNTRGLMACRAGLGHNLLPGRTQDKRQDNARCYEHPYPEVHNREPISPQICGKCWHTALKRSYRARLPRRLIEHGRDTRRLREHPNCPRCLTRMVLAGTEERPYWLCDDCGFLRLS
jgi:ribosomal protein S27AE